jgi:hypothetical protein
MRVLLLALLTLSLLVVGVRRLLAGLTQTELSDLTQFLIQQRQVRTQAVLLLWVVVTVALITLMAVLAVLAVVVAMMVHQVAQALQDKVMLEVTILEPEIVQAVGAVEQEQLACKMYLLLLAVMVGLALQVPFLVL